MTAEVQGLVYPGRKEERIVIRCMSAVGGWWVIKGHAFVGFDFYWKLVVKEPKNTPSPNTIFQCLTLMPGNQVGSKFKWMSRKISIPSPRHSFHQSEVTKGLVVPRSRVLKSRPRM